MTLYTIDGYLNNYGFCVQKKKINNSIGQILMEYFKVKPEYNYENEKIDEDKKYFEVFYQDEKYIVLPKFSTGLTISIPKNNNKKNVIIDNIVYTQINFKINKFKYKKELVNFNFNGKLRDYQQVIIDQIIKKFGLEKSNPHNHQISQTFPKGGLIKLSCGGGKCLGYNTPVMMFDGSIKYVQDIQIGDKLMGDDSKPRNVLELARGRELMYKIIQDDGDSYVVNSSHILSLYNPKTEQITDIGIQDYLKLEDKYIGPSGISLTSKLKQQYTVKGGLYGFRVKTEFESKPIPFDPYLFGKFIGLYGFHSNKINNSVIINNNIINNYFYDNNLKDNPRITLEYKANDTFVQLNVLAGIIDTIGSIDNNYYILNLINNEFAKDICFILKSLNLKYFIDININNYCKIILYGNKIIHIPTKIIKLNNYDSFNEEKINITWYKIKVIQLEEDEYYGFEIDGNRRFLLGDFTVTHNTMLAIYLSWLLGLKTLVVTHKEFLMDQWEERINQFTNARVGKIRQNIINVENKDIVIGMLRSLSMKDYPKEILQQFGLVIYDEVHHTGSRVDSQALLKTSAEYTIGLSATPDRVDGMTKVINWHVGDILYEMEKKYNYRVLVKKVYFRSVDPLFKEKKMYFQGRFAPNHTVMTGNLTEIKSRNQLIVNIIDVLKGAGRKILILSYRVEHLEMLKKMVDSKIKADGEAHIYNSYYYMGKTKRTEKRMAESDGDIIFATMQLAEEGLDIPHLDTVLFALPVNIQKTRQDKNKKISKTLIQSIGRALRKEKLDVLTQIPLVIDISDMLSLYSGWSNKRNDVFNEKNWYIQNYYWEDLEFTYQPNQDKKIKPLNIMFDDISDEDFIEKNLIISDEENNKNSDKSNDLSKLNNDSIIINNNNLQLDKDNKTISISTYGFGKKKINP